MVRELIIRLALKLPKGVLDNFLLSFPSMYKNNFINYESGVAPDDMKKLIDVIKEVKELPGDIIECGSNRCGTTAILANYLKSDRIEKKIFALDSFSGFDPKEIEEERKEGFTDFSPDSYHYNSYKYVVKKIEKLNLSDIIFPIKGYFQDTLPKIDSKFCLGFIDCDLRESITYTAEKIWSQLVEGGILFFHDYGYEHFKGVKPAVDKFVKKHLEQIEKHYRIYYSYYVKKKSEKKLQK